MKKENKMGLLDTLTNAANALKDAAIQQKATTCSADFSDLNEVESWLIQELTQDKPKFTSFGIKIIQELKGDNKKNAQKVMNWTLAYLAQKGQTKQYTTLRSNAPQGMTFDIDTYYDKTGTLKKGATSPALTQNEIQNLDFNKSVFEQPMGLLNLEAANLTYRDLLGALGKCKPERFKTLLGALNTLTQGEDLPPVLGQIQHFLDPNMAAPTIPADDLPDLSAKVITNPTEFSACQGKKPMDLANQAFAAINTAPEEEEKKERFLNFYKNLLQAKDLAPEKAEDIDTVLPLLSNLYTAKFGQNFPEEAVQQATPKHPFLTFLMPIIQAFKKLATLIISFFAPKNPERQADNSEPVSVNLLDQKVRMPKTQQASKAIPTPENEPASEQTSEGNKGISEQKGDTEPNSPESNSSLPTTGASLADVSPTVAEPVPAIPNKDSNLKTPTLENSYPR